MSLSNATAKLFFSIFLASLLTSCGGGSGASSETPKTDVKSGRFIDSPVSGLSYTTPTQSGITDENGTFTYMEGETIKFNIGNWVTHEITAKAKITPFDLYSGAKPLEKSEDIINAIVGDESYRYVVNVAVFLQTLDFDAIPENGIEITPEVASFFADNSSNNYLLDFTDSTDAFQSIFFEVIRVMNRANIFPDARVVTDRVSAMAHLYANLDGVNAAYGLTSQRVTRISDSETVYTRDVRYDRGYIVRDERDSIIDLDLEYRNEEEYYSDYLYEATYDDRNYVLTTNYDNNGDGFFNIMGERFYTIDGTIEKYITKEDWGDDGTIDYRDEIDFDSFGRIISISYYDEQNGALIYKQTLAYDNKGNTIDEATDWDGNGIIDNEIKKSFHDNNTLKTEEYIGYDETGKEAYRSTYEYDIQSNILIYQSYDDGDTSPSHTQTYSYNQDYQEILYTQINKGDSEPSYIRSTEYDSNDLVRQVLTDSDGDGSNNSKRYYEYDNNNNLVLEQYDYELSDHVVNSEYQWAYDSLNRLTHSKIYYYGNLESEVKYVYNPDGSSEEKLFSYNGNTGEVIYRSINHYDANDNETYYASYFNEGEDLSYEKIALYDNDNFLLEESIDWDGSGNINHKLATIRDKENNYIQTYEGFDNDGVLNSRSIIHYDQEKRETFHESDWDLDGNPEYIHEYTYNNGNLTKESYHDDYDSDGIRSISTWYYYENGNKTRYEVDEDYIEGGDNTFEHFKNYLYDDSGNLVRLEVEDTGDEIVDRISVMTYAENSGWEDIFREVTDRYYYGY